MMSRPSKGKTAHRYYQKLVIVCITHFQYETLCSDFPSIHVDFVVPLNMSRVIDRKTETRTHGVKFLSSSAIPTIQSCSSLEEKSRRTYQSKRKMPPHIKGMLLYLYSHL